ncbi:hypothetical protein BGX26_001958 [Mortierella sp. AD094]|nr:hypothetical protein BGX26_001958 [Mortierella sp. AD094]
MALMDKEFYSILLLKEAPAGQDSSDSHHQHQNDPYKTALHSLTLENVETTVEYLAPMTTVYPECTPLSNAIAEGYPKTPYHPLRRASDSNSSSDESIWAFAVTSQNAVHAVEKALQGQSDPDIREAWLQIPVYCLTGATLASVEKIGFKNINCANTSVPTTEPLSFGNASQLADFLVTIEWPTVGDGKDGVAASAPVLWFLTGEVRMRTMADKLTAHQKPFREVVVYETGQRVEFEQEFYHWLRNTSGLHWSEKASDIGSDGSSPAGVETKVRRTLWLVGFSPRGVEIAGPTQTRFLEEANGNQVCSIQPSFGASSVEIRWAAIGATTAKRIQEHLANCIVQVAPNIDATLKQSQQHRRVILNSAVVVAKAPKPDALAEAILSRTL